LWIAFFLGSLSKALIFKASGGVKRDYQQSYPQKFWICLAMHENQGLSHGFKTVVEVLA
jgi:hypothetical protein